MSINLWLFSYLSVWTYVNEIIHMFKLRNKKRITLYNLEICDIMYHYV